MQVLPYCLSVTGSDTRDFIHLHAHMCLCPLFPVSLPPFLTLSSVLVPRDWQRFPLIPLFHYSSFLCPIPPSLLYSNNPSSPTLSHFFNEMTPANLIKSPTSAMLVVFSFKMKHIKPLQPFHPSLFDTCHLQFNHAALQPKQSAM